VAAVLLSLSSVSLFSDPCDFRRSGDMRFRPTAYDVAADLGDVWIATGHGVELWRRAGLALAPQTSLAVPGTSVAVEADLTGAWVGSGEGIHFVERSTPLRIASSLALGAAVNDLAVSGSWIYVATTAGITQVDAIDRDHPQIARQLNTTSGPAFSLAILGNHLYATDGDRTVEVYAIGTPTIPQKVGTFDSLARSLDVHAAGGNLLVSDGQQTEVFAGSGALMTRLGVLRFGAASAAAGTGSLRFVAGSDRTVRAIDILAPVPTVFAAARTSLTAGTVNRITGLAVTGDLLVASAGDAGVAAWSIADVESPFPSASFEVGGVGSAWIAAGRAVVALPAGGLRRYSESSGLMNPGPAWEQGRLWKIHDGAGDSVLASSGASLHLWDAAATTPASISSAALGGDVVGAAMTGDRKAVAILADRTAWSVDFSQAAAVTSKLAIAGAPAFVAASSAGIAFGEITPQGNTLIRFYRNGEIAAPVEVTVDGTSNGGIALSPSGIAAAATFRGLALADVSAGGAPRYVAESDAAPVRDVEIDGDLVLMLESDGLVVRRISDGALLSAWEIDGEPAQVQASTGRAIVAGENGFTTIDLARSPSPPVPIALAQQPPRFFRSVERDEGNLWLVERSRADWFDLSGLGLPHGGATLTYEGTIAGSAAARGNLYTISAGGLLTGRNRSGEVVAQMTIAEAADQQIGGLLAIRDALWLTITSGCSTGGCQTRALVIDTEGGLGVVSTVPGGAVDAVWSGDRAWVLSDSPREARVYDIASPTRPMLLNAVASTGDPVSIAHGAGSVWTLGSRLVRLTESLQPGGEYLEPWTADPAGRVAYIDQKVRFAGDCLVIAGREPSPRVYSVDGGALAPAGAPAAVGAVRDLAVGPESIHLLGETSLETWTTAAPPERTRLLRR
jgi:hypothetical protein